MASADEPGAAALAALEDTFDKLLLQIGSVLHSVPDNGQSLDSRHLAQSSTHMKSYIPKALDRFHDNLDELENELVRAQMVIRRDLLLSRIKPASVKDAASPVHNDQDMPDAGPVTDANKTGGADVDSTTADNIDVKSVDKDELATAQESAPAEDDLDAMFKDLTNPDASGDDKVEDVDKTEQSDNAATAADGSASQQPSQALSADAHQVNAADDDADVSSLLPGLDSYANADNGMPDFPSGDFDANQNKQGGDAQAFGGDFDFEDLINQDFSTGIDQSTDEVDYNQFDDDFFKL